MNRRYMLVVTADRLDLLKRQVADSDIGFEIRLDTFDDIPDFKAIRASTTAPLLATFRSKPHCGHGAVEERSTRGWAWRLKALDAGFDAVDVELDEADAASYLDDIRVRGGASVLSHHETRGGTDLMPALRKALDFGADTTKIIGTGQAIADLATQKQAYRLAAGRQLVFFFMGAEFAASRWLSLKYGAPFTFVMPDASAQVAPGVPTLLDARRIYAMTAHQSYESLFAVVGSPIGHSQSPKFHNPLLKQKNGDALFLAIPAALGQLEQVLSTFPELKGLAVTKPLKEEAFERAEQFGDRDVEALGAINTLVLKQGAWHGENTDYLAMKALLRQYVKGTRLRVLGFGGLGKAVVLAGLSLGLVVEVTNRSMARLKDVNPAANVLPWADRHREGAEVIVQATSVGMAPEIDASPLDDLPASTTVVIETIYQPLETTLLKMARAKGLATVDGLALFNKQAEIQNKFFKEALD